MRAIEAQTVSGYGGLRRIGRPALSRALLTEKSGLAEGSRRRAKALTRGRLALKWDAPIFVEPSHKIADLSCEPCDVDGCVWVEEIPELIPLAKIPMYPSSHEIRDAEPIF